MSKRFVNVCIVGVANSSPSAVAATNASTAPMELQILVDRLKCKVQFDYEKLGEQGFRVRVIVVVKSEGEECKEELVWVQVKDHYQA